MFEFGDFQYSVGKDGNARIEKYRGGASALKIPGEIDGGSVTAIGDDAFSGCSNLAIVTIPDSVTAIGAGAFAYCTNLTSITISDSVTFIGGGAFVGIGGSIEVSPNHPVFGILSDGLVDKNEKILIWYPASKAGGHYAIPDGITAVGAWVFMGCSNLASITIPDSVTAIGAATFGRCANLTSITIPDGVTAIGDEAFSYCANLTSITIPDSVTVIGDEAFSYCTNLTSITIPDSVTAIGDGAFDECPPGLVIQTSPNAYAAEYALDYNINVMF
jgi:hypothetical protein